MREGPRCYPRGLTMLLWMVLHARGSLMCNMFKCKLTKKCAVKGAELQRVRLPPGNWFAPPVAIEAAVEATKLSELSMERVARRLRERAGHNMSER